MISRTYIWLRKDKIPHTFVIVFGIIVIAAISTWFVEGGEYARSC